MKVSIFGTGYVGLVTGSCLAEVGHHVECVDIDVNKIELLKQGHIPIYEPGLKNLVDSNVAAGNLTFTSDAVSAVKQSNLIIIAVGTPPNEDGSADLQQVLVVASCIGAQMQDHKFVVTKSTVPVGTADKVSSVIEDELRKRGVSITYDVISNPEFLKEGAAVSDCMRPDRIIVGAEGVRAIEVMRELYEPFNRNHDKLLVMDKRSAELTKYAANCMLATKISFMNEMANIAEKLGADIEKVRVGIGSDPRIGYHFIYPGCGFGGSCFPKDIRALINSAREINYESKILNAVEEVNNAQKGKLLDIISAHYKGELGGRTFAVWGLAFKPNTNDMRDAPSRVLIEGLLSCGARIQAFDPEAMEEAKKIYGDCEGFVLSSTKDESIKSADALVICTEWQNFRAPDFDSIKNELKEAVIFDGRNLFEPAKMEAAEIAYYAIGRGLAVSS
ncbi:MAG: UDP-glucose/GDP-mannose dehydrogenase family protein [Gammaproteobacteria bacterium]|jgi:UDPglucose 6-dehydrogenase